MSPQSQAALAALVILWFLESWFPFFYEFNQTRERFTHAWRNLLMGALNALVLGALFAGVTAYVASYAREAGFGLFPWLSLGIWTEIIIAILIFDAWMYLWHRLNHVIPLLWRFHQVHHSDPRMDVTSGVRFHPGEIALSHLARLIVIPFLGLDLWHLVIYESLLLPVILLHHSNVALPARLDAILRCLIVSPNMHRVHHSNWQPETDSNYSSVFSIWDRIFRSYRWRDDYHTIQYGLTQLTEEKWHTFKGILSTPFRKMK